MLAFAPSTAWSGLGGGTVNTASFISEMSVAHGATLRLLFGGPIGGEGTGTCEGRGEMRGKENYIN